MDQFKALVVLLMEQLTLIQQKYYKSCHPIEVTMNDWGHPIRSDLGLKCCTNILFVMLLVFDDEMKI